MILLTRVWLLQLAAVCDGDRGGHTAALAAVGLNFLDHIHAAGNIAKHDMLAVQPRRCRRAQEELLVTCEWMGTGSVRRNSAVSAVRLSFRNRTI